MFAERLCILSGEKRTYALHLPSHLIAAERWDSLLHALTSFDYIEFKCQAGKTRELATHYDVAERTAPPGSPFSGERWLQWRQFVALEAHFLEQHLGDYPQLVQQQALNLPDCAVRRAALQRDAAILRRSSPWIERVNRPTRFVPSASMGIYLRKTEHIRVTGDGVAITSDGQTAEAWKLSDGELLLRLEGHTGAIKQVSLIASGRVAISSDDGSICVWDLSSKSLLMHSADRKSAPDGSEFVITDKYIVTGLSGDFLSSDYSLHVLDGATGELLRTMQGHLFGLYFLGALADGRVVSISHDRTLRVWDPTSGSLQSLIEDHDLRDVKYVLLSEEYAASYGVPRTKDSAALRIWSLTSGNCIQEIVTPERVSQVRSALNGRLICAVCGKSLLAWHLQSGELVGRLDDPDGNIAILALTADERRVICSFGQGRLRVWNIETGETWALTDDQGKVPLVVVEDRLVAACSPSNEINVWDLDTGRLLRVLRGHAASVTKLVPAGPNRLVSASDDDTVRVWDISPTTLRHEEQRHVKGSTPKLTPDGRGLTLNDRNLRVWNMEEGSCQHTLEHRAEVKECVCTPSGFAVTYANDDAVWVWDLKSGANVHRLPHPAPITSLRLASAEHVYTTSTDGTLRVWNVARGERVGRTSQPDEDRVHTGTLEIGSWMTFDETEIARKAARRASDILGRPSTAGMIPFIGKKSPALELPKGRAVVTNEGDMSIWDLTTGECIQVFSGAGVAVCVLRDGRVISVDESYSLHLWSLEDNRCERVWHGHTTHLTDVVEMEDGYILSVGPYSFRVWHSGADECVRVFDTEGALISRWRREQERLTARVITRGVAKWGDRGSRVLTWDWKSGVLLSDVEALKESQEDQAEPAIVGWTATAHGLVWTSNHSAALYPLQGKPSFAARPDGVVLLTEHLTGEVHIVRLREDSSTADRSSEESTQPSGVEQRTTWEDFKLDPIFGGVLDEAAKRSEQRARMASRIHMVVAVAAIALAIGLWVVGGWWRLASVAIGLYASVQALSAMPKVARRLHDLDFAPQYQAATLLWKEGHHKEALAAFERFDREFTQKGNSLARAMTLIDMGAILDEIDDAPRALACLEQAEALLSTRRDAAHAVRQLRRRCLAAQWLLMRKRVMDNGNLLLVLSRLKDVVAFEGDEASRRTILVEIARIHARNNNLSELFKLMQEYGDVEAFQKELGIVPTDPSEVEELRQQSLFDDRFAERTIGALDPTQHARLWIERGNELSEVGRMEQALRAYEQAESCARKFGDMELLQAAIADQASMLRVLRKGEQFRQRLDAALELARTFPDPEPLAKTIEAFSRWLLESGENLPLALQLARELEQIARRHENWEQLEQALSRQADIHRRLQEHDTALAVLEQLAALLLKEGKDEALYNCLELQGAVLSRRDAEPTGALAAFEAAETIGRRLDNMQMVASSLFNQSAMLEHITGRGREAIPRAEQARTLARQNGQAELEKKASDLLGRLKREYDRSTSERTKVADGDNWLTEPEHRPGVLRHQREDLGLLMDREAILKAIVPLMRRERESVVEMYHSILSSLNMVEIMPGTGALGITFCYDCPRVLMDLGNTSHMKGHIDCTFGCGPKPLHYLISSPDPRAVIRSLFERHVTCVNWLDQCEKMQERDPAGALHAAQEAEAICRELGNTAVRADALQAQAEIHLRRNDADSALPMYLEQARLSEVIGDNERLIRSWLGQAIIKSAAAKMPEALSLLRNAEDLCLARVAQKGDRFIRQLYVVADLKCRLLTRSPDGFDEARGTVRATKEAFDRAAQRLGHPPLRDFGTNLEAFVESAIAQHKSPERLISDPKVFEIDAREKLAAGDVPRALEMFARLREHYTKENDGLGLLVCLSDQGSLLVHHKLWDPAAEVYERMEEIVRPSEQKQLLFVALSNLSAVLLAKGESGSALERLTEQELLAKGLEDPALVTHTLRQKATALANQGHLEQAATAISEAEVLCEKVGNASQLKECLQVHGQLAEALEQWEKVGAIGQKLEALCAEGDDAGLADALRFRARMLAETEQWEASLDAWKRCAHHAQRQRNEVLRIDSLVYQGFALEKLGNQHATAVVGQEIYEAWMGLAKQNDVDGWSRVLKILPRVWPNLSMEFSRLFASQAKELQGAAAVGVYESALQLNPEDPNLLNQLAWLRSTSADESVRHGKRAVDLARKACELTGWREWALIDTYGAALAETGRYKEAIRWAEVALDLAPNEAAEQEVMRSLDLYRSGKPHREEIVGSPA